MVCKIIIENGCVIGVEVEIDGMLIELKVCKEVIFFGGVINLFQILFLLGIGLADELCEVGVSVEYDLLGVGKNLQDYFDVMVQIWMKFLILIGNFFCFIFYYVYMMGCMVLMGDGLVFVNLVQGGVFIKLVYVEDLLDLQFVFILVILNLYGIEKVWGYGVILYVCQFYLCSCGEICLKFMDLNDYFLIQFNYLDEEFDVDVMMDGFVKV